MSFQVTILGTSSATPTLHRNPSAQLLEHNRHLFLIDCGEGTQMQLRRYHLKLTHIDHVLISHLHGDHFLGLPGLISSLHLMNRTHDLHIYCQPELKDILELQFRISDTWLRYKLVFHFLNEKEQELIYEDNNLLIYSFPLNHRVPCNGFRFQEKAKPHPLKKEMLDFYKVPLQWYPRLKRGENYIDEAGVQFPNNLFTKPQPKSYSYAYCSDTMFDTNLIPFLEQVDVLYHESTFLNDLEARAKETYHSTAGQAAQIAKLSKAGKLLLGHFSARYKSIEPFETEAKEVFLNSEIALEGKCYQINPAP
jgi:ribonuclease Z